jgi:ABC-type transport system involved in cytochrome bd biosynthesis fused ATPase/permease subunit
MAVKDIAPSNEMIEEDLATRNNAQQIPIVTCAQPYSPDRFCSLTLTIRPDDIVVAVMGVTGSGKTTFVNHLSDFPLSIGHGLNSC